VVNRPTCTVVVSDDGLWSLPSNASTVRGEKRDIGEMVRLGGVAGTAPPGMPTAWKRAPRSIGTDTSSARCARACGVLLYGTLVSSMHGICLAPAPTAGVSPLHKQFEMMVSDAGFTWKPVLPANGEKPVRGELRALCVCAVR
jgi:hypothetical protein